MSISMSVRRWCLVLAIAGLASTATSLPLVPHDAGGACPLAGADSFFIRFDGFCAGGDARDQSRAPMTA
jgi:hypothetical protein